MQAFSSPPFAQGSQGGARAGYLAPQSSAEGLRDPLNLTRGESSRLAPARKFSFSASRLGKAAASSEERRDSDDDDVDGDGEGADANSSADEEVEKNSFKKRLSPLQSSQTLKDQWLALMNFEDETAKAFGPKGMVSIMKRWGDKTGSPFHRPSEDPCIKSLFETFKTKEKTQFEQFTATAASSAAGGHAVLTAWDCVKSAVAEFDNAAKFFRRDPDSVSKEDLIDLIVAASSALSDSACSPLIDAASILSSLHGKMISAVRKGVIDVAPKDTKIALRDHKPANSFYFGNPLEELRSQMDFDLVRHQLHSSTSSSSSSYARNNSQGFKRPITLSRGRTSTESSSSASTSASSSTPNDERAKSGYGGSKRQFQKRGGKGAK